MVTVAKSFEAPIKCKYVTLRVLPPRCVRSPAHAQTLLQWYSHRTCWRKDLKPVTLPCSVWVTSSSRVYLSPCCCASTSGSSRPFLLHLPPPHSVKLSILNPALFFFSPCSLKKNSRTYFYSSFLAYIFGLGLTIFVMHTFKHAQVRGGGSFHLFTDTCDSFLPAW